jgi:hypothetical protein
MIVGHRPLRLQQLSQMHSTSSISPRIFHRYDFHDEGLLILFGPLGCDHIKRQWRRRD